MAPFPSWLSVGQACDVLGVDPFSPVPDYSTMRRYIRRLQLLLHPDRVLLGCDAARAQQEFSIDFKALRAVEGYLLPANCTEDMYTTRIESLCNKTKNSDCWVSQWNPHKLESDAMFEPLPAWTRWRKSSRVREPGSAKWAQGTSRNDMKGAPKGSRSSATRSKKSKGHRKRDISRIDVSKFPPSSIDDAPRFDGSDLKGALPPQEGTQSLLRFIWRSDIIRGSNVGVSVASVQMRWGEEGRREKTATAEAIIETPPPSWGRKAPAEDLPVTLLLKTKNGTTAKAKTYLKTVTPVRWRDLSTSPLWCPGPHGSGGTYGIDRMRLVVTHWNGVFKASPGNGRYVAEFLSRVSESLS